MAVYLIGYLLLVNGITFVMYGVDKRRARIREYRIPERTLLLAAAVGGAYGAGLGMLYFHHKTKKWKFRLLVPLFILLESIGIVMIGAGGVWNLL